jgi:hypothetical protein
MGFSRDGGAYTIARWLATRLGRRSLAWKDLGSQAVRRKPDKNPDSATVPSMAGLGSISPMRSSKMAANQNNDMELL